MKKQKVYEEMMEILEECGQVLVTLKDDEYYSIDPATDFVGGDEGYYMSRNLGNVQYCSEDEVVYDLMKLFDCEDVIEISAD